MKVRKWSFRDQSGGSAMFQARQINKQMSKQQFLVGLTAICVFAVMLVPRISNAAADKAAEAKGKAALKACALQYKVALPLPKQLDNSTKQQLKACVIARGYTPDGYKKNQEQLANCLSREGISLPEGARTPADDQTKEAIRQCKEQIKKHS